jgi:hypothetical protein
MAKQILPDGSLIRPAVKADDRRFDQFLHRFADPLTGL